MISMFFATTLMCSQIVTISEKLVRHVHLNSVQKRELFQLLKKEVPNCPVYYDESDTLNPIKLKKS